MLSQCLLVSLRYNPRPQNPQYPQRIVYAGDHNFVKQVDKVVTEAGDYTFATVSRGLGLRWYVSRDKGT